MPTTAARSNVPTTAASTNVPTTAASANVPTTAASVKTPEPVVIQCAKDEFQCYDGVKCFPWSCRCDKTSNCHDNSDEADCAGTVYWSILASL